MKLSFLTLGIIVLIANHSWTAELVPLLTKHEALKAILLFRQDPQSDLGRGAGGLIINFAEKNHDVSVRISPKVVPFLSNKSLSLDYRSTLLAAFTVGNIDSQLLRSEK